MLLAMENATTTEISNETAVAARLILLLRIVHQVLLSNCPTVAAAATAGVEGDADKWAKSSQLRSRLGEIAILPLWMALATSFQKLSKEMQEQYQNEVKGMMEEWREHNVFGGPTVWEEYKRGWGRALKEVGDAGSRGEGVESISAGVAEDATTITEPVVDDAKKELLVQVQQSTVSKESSQNEENDNVIEDPVIEKRETQDESDVVVETVPVSLAVVEESGEGKVARATKRDSVASASVDVEVDFEGVEEARVEPSQFLDACKVIASIQITRDLGSDSAMNLSSALSNITPQVEEACNTILTQQQNGQDETPITELLPTDSLSNLPDDLLNLDLKYAKKSLQTYKEAIRQQRKARLQCLQLLLQSRCSFGSMDAARAFCGGEGSDVNMDNVLDKLKKRKEILVDALALEGLDVEEDEEEKKMEKDEEELKPLIWFSKVDSKGVEEEPAAKKLKSC